MYIVYDKGILNADNATSICLKYDKKSIVALLGYKLRMEADCIKLGEFDSESAARTELACIADSLRRKDSVYTMSTVK